MFVSKPRGFDHALEVCDLATDRLKCINRELSKPLDDPDCLTPEIRARVCTALRNHLHKCEQMPMEQVNAALP